ncbi:MAG TPA: hypothetical protein VFB31_09410 [Pseudolabrys sp.]|nr:hypothetical protein [Pseudolabrys sp.]
MKHLATAATIALLTAAALPGPARAQCAEGMTASGACVDAGLAAGARLNALTFSQPKISYTAYPLLPNGDFTFRYPYNLILDPLAGIAQRGKPCVPTRLRAC